MACQFSWGSSLNLDQDKNLIRVTISLYSNLNRLIIIPLFWRQVSSPSSPSVTTGLIGMVWLVRSNLLYHPRRHTTFTLINYIVGDLSLLLSVNATRSYVSITGIATASLIFIGVCRIHRWSGEPGTRASSLRYQIVYNNLTLAAIYDSPRPFHKLGKQKKLSSVTKTNISLVEI